MAAALLLIDMQRAIDDPSWSREGGRNHPDAEGAALRLLDAWRTAHWPIYHVRHTQWNRNPLTGLGSRETNSSPDSNLGPAKS